MLEESLPTKFPVAPMAVADAEIGLSTARHGPQGQGH